MCACVYMCMCHLLCTIDVHDIVPVCVYFFFYILTIHEQMIRYIKTHNTPGINVLWSPNTRGFAGRNSALCSVTIFRQIKIAEYHQHGCFVAKQSLREVMYCETETRNG